MESKAKHAAHASAFFVVCVVKQKFLKSETFTGMFKLFHLNVLQIHAMSKRLHPSSFCNDKSLKAKT